MLIISVAPRLIKLTAAVGLACFAGVVEPAFAADARHLATRLQAGLSPVREQIGYARD
jgi:hypothetical protein